MTGSFKQLGDKMCQLLEILRKSPLYSRENLKGIPDMGVYVFYENKLPMYVGRSNHLKTRIMQYSISKLPIGFSRKLGENMIKDQGIELPALKCKDLETEYPEYFKKARKRISEMPVRVIKIEEQKEQAVFEIYAALELNSKYNDFGTH